MNMEEKIARVGHFDAGGLVVGSDWDGGRGSHLGIAASRKF